MEEIVVSNDGAYLPQLMTPPSFNRKSVIAAVPKLNRQLHGAKIGSKPNLKLQNFSCPMCPRVFHNCEDLKSHAHECLDSDPRVTGKINENRKLPEERKPVKPKQKTQGEKNKEKGLKTSKDRKPINKEKGKGNGKGGKPALIPSLDDLVNYKGEEIKLRLLLLQLGVKTAKINLSQLKEGTTEGKWNRSFVTKEIKSEVHGAKEWNEYTLRKRMRNAEREVEKLMFKKEANRTGMGDLDRDVDATKTPEKEMDIQMSQLKKDLDKMREIIDTLYTKKYKESQPNPKFEPKTKNLKETCNPVDIEDEADPEMAANEEVFENQKESEIINVKIKGTKTLKGTLSNKNAERYDNSRNEKEYSSSESDDDEPMEVTLKKFMKSQLKESKQNKNKMLPQPPSLPFVPYGMGIPYGGFGYPQSYMQAGGYPYGMTSRSPPDPNQNQEKSVDTSNGGDSESDPPPPPMQYNPYEGFLPAAGPGSGTLLPGAVRVFPPGAVRGFPHGAVRNFSTGAFPPGGVRGFLPPRPVVDFQPAGIGGFPAAAGRGFLPSDRRGFPSPAGRGSMPGARPASTAWLGGDPGFSGHIAAPDIGGEASQGLGSGNRKSIFSGFVSEARGEEFGFSAGTASEDGFRDGRAGFLPNGGFIVAAVSADSSSGSKKSDTFSTVTSSESG